MNSRQNCIVERHETRTERCHERRVACERLCLVRHCKDRNREMLRECSVQGNKRIESAGREHSRSRSEVIAARELALRRTAADD
jgi:hypothetical protein